MLQREPIDLNVDYDLKYSTPGSTLHPADLALCEGLEATEQNFCLSDPLLPDNPITFASQAFLNMTGYNLTEILGRNCRFLQGKDTDKYHVDRVRLSIKEGADCHVCLLNYRKDGTPFYNRLFMTALRDTKGRVKNYLGVQCEVSAEVAKKINGQEKALFDAGMRRKGDKVTKRQSRKSSMDSTARTIESTSSSSSTNDEIHSVKEVDIEEALFRATMDNPWGEMTEDEKLLFEASKMGTWDGGYTTKVEISNAGDMRFL